MSRFSTGDFAETGACGADSEFWVWCGGIGRRCREGRQL